MHIQVAYVHAPYVMPTLGPERHVCLGARPARHLEVVQAPVDGKIAATGSTGELDAHLLKGRADAIGTKQGILRQLFNLLDRLNINFAQLFACMGFIFQSGKLLLRKTLENLVDRLSAYV